MYMKRIRIRILSNENENKKKRKETEKNWTERRTDGELYRMTRERGKITFGKKKLNKKHEINETNGKYCARKRNEVK